MTPLPKIALILLWLRNWDLKYSFTNVQFNICCASRFVISYSSKLSFHHASSSGLALEHHHMIWNGASLSKEGAATAIHYVLWISPRHIYKHNQFALIFFHQKMVNLNKNGMRAHANSYNRLQQSSALPWPSPTSSQPPLKMALWQLTTVNPSKLQYHAYLNHSRLTQRTSLRRPTKAYCKFTGSTRSWRARHYLVKEQTLLQRSPQRLLPL